MKKYIITCLSLTVLILAAATAALATDYYVSPTDGSPVGLPTGKGTLASPWDLETALKDNTNPANANHVLRPGDTIYLRGGTYIPTSVGSDGFNDKYYSVLLGSASQSIIVRPYQNEHVIIHAGISQNKGGYVTFRDFELTSSDTDTLRVSAISGSFPTDIPVPKGFEIYAAPGVKVINNVIHDEGGDGIYVNNDCHGTKIYGNICYHDGWATSVVIDGQPERAHGHEFYTKNIGPEPIILRNNITFSAFNFLIQAYGSASPSYVYDITFDGNIFFNGEFCIKQENYPPAGIKIINNVFGEGTGCGPDPIPTINLDPVPVVHDLVVDNNYITVGGGVLGWNKLEMIGNHIAYWWIVAPPAGGYTPGDYVINGNTYYGWGVPQLALDVDHPGDYTWKSVCSYGDLQGYWSAWKSNGFDTDGQALFQTSLPSPPDVVVRPNKYDDNRSYIAVINWRGVDTTVPVNLNTIFSAGDSHAFQSGDSYEIRDVQNYYQGTPVSGTYSSGGTVNLPLVFKPSDIDPYIGDFTGNSLDPRQPHTSLAFNVFVLIRTNGSGAVLFGDVNGDGVISASDAVLAAQHAVGLITLTSSQITKADVSDDGSVTAYDAALIAERAAGLITKFPVE